MYAEKGKCHMSKPALTIFEQCYFNDGARDDL